MLSAEGYEPRNIAADSSRRASTPHGAHARMPHPDASTLDARPPSVPLHLQIDGENRSCSVAAEQVCEKWTLTTLTARRLNSLLPASKFPAPRQKFPAPASREFACKLLILQSSEVPKIR